MMLNSIPTGSAATKAKATTKIVPKMDFFTGHHLRHRIGTPALVRKFLRP